MAPLDLDQPFDTTDASKGALVPRVTIEALVARRNHALELYAQAHDAIAACSQALIDAARAACPSRRNGYNYFQDAERQGFIGKLDVPEREKFLSIARRLTDCDTWAYLVELTDLERLMDTKAKAQLTRQLQTDPPEVTIDNVLATLQQMAGNAHMIFKRGLAECFSNLDRRFRSHDGWKLGSRIILTYALGDSGGWNWNSDSRNRIYDVERVFNVLDGRGNQPLSLIAQIERDRGGHYGRRQGYTETEYFRCRSYMNGNVHLWFQRDDLVEKANKLLADYYGAAIPQDREPEEDTGLFKAKTAPAKNLGYFPTPDAAADTVIEESFLYRADGEPALTVLEPSAGDGALASRAVLKGCIVDCVELHSARAAGLRVAGLYRGVWNMNFLDMKPDPARLYDRVVMNPPFDRERDIDHVLHAMEFLKPDGILISVMSAGTEFRETRKSVAFRTKMQAMKAGRVDLPPGAFASVGTWCNTLILIVNRNGSGRYGGYARHHSWKPHYEA
jgi:predicted RNA methylase